MRETFVFYSSFYTSAIHLPELERNEFLFCVIEYSLTGKIKTMPEGVVRAMFESCKVNIDKQRTNYQNGSKPKKKQKQTGSETKAKQKPTTKRTANYKEKEKEKDKDKDKDNIPKGISVSSWEEWKKYRKESKKTLTASTESKQLHFLELHLEDHVEIINQSIQNGWAGLFKLKNEKQTLPEMDLTQFGLRGGQNEN